MWLIRACLSEVVLLDLARAVSACCFVPLRAGIAAISTDTGMTILGIAVLLARRFNGWHRYAPLDVGATCFIQVVFQALFA